jgi:hypothetical protein
VSRRASTIGLLFLAGAATSVLVAWACALLSPVEPDPAYSMRMIERAEFAPLPTWWPTDAFQDPGRQFLIGRAVGFGVTRDSYTPSLDLRGPDERYGTAMVQVTTIAYQISAGWPLRCLEGEQIDGGVFPDAPTAEWKPQSGIEMSPVAALRGRVGRVGFLPLRPRFAGLVLNALAYGSLLWLLTVASRSATRRVLRTRRRRRGLCPRCRYPVGRSPRCAECGSVLRPTSH